MGTVELYLIRLWARIFNHRKEDNYYYLYNAVSRELDFIDPKLVLESKLMGGQIDAYFLLYNASPYLFQAKKLIYRNLPNAIICEAEKSKPAMFY